MSKKKKKITAYADIFAGKLEKLKGKIKQARKDGNLTKEQLKRLVKEAKGLRDTLKELAEED